MKRARTQQALQPKSGKQRIYSHGFSESNGRSTESLQKNIPTTIPIRISRQVPVTSEILVKEEGEGMSTQNREIWNPMNGQEKNFGAPRKPGTVKYSQNPAGPSMVHDSIWNPSQLVSMNDLEQLSGEGFDDLFSYSSSPEARSPTNVTSQQPGMFRPGQAPMMKPSPPMQQHLPQQLSPEHQQYVEWDQSKLIKAQKESMEPSTRQVPRENIWQKSQMVTFDDIMQQSGLDEFSELVEAEQGVAQNGGVLKPSMILPPGHAEPAPQEPKTKDQMIDELKRIQQDFAFSKIDDFLGRYNEKEEPEKQTPEQPQIAQSSQMQPITADQISGMLKVQPVAGSTDMVLSLEQSPSSSIQTQLEYEERMNAQRKINNEAAQRSRVKKRKMIEEKLKKISIFEEENPKLKMRLDTHMKELDRLKRMLAFYVDYTKNKKVSMTG
ncbi:Oidioi.mRNA.OKI2018_I69.chr2.g5951.t1.cds [Oikopleura dioica]|uniref:Oidioi.mRNA.OKI2018_I69.chr2.g5951.t1.cds n=1 Tax=Oikopleura dioica TaxID=34765 RepID=A0ABN7T221_OIKDI|nr:Oidioi.mRNA.OKI2018_I69.chr2.g5951.t1.cds [Oikopleura dioica]